MLSNLSTLQAHKDFLSHLYQLGSETTTEDELEKLYSKPIIVQFDGEEVHLHFNASNYNFLVSLLEQAINEY